MSTKIINDLRNKSHKERWKQLDRSKNIKQMQLGSVFFFFLNIQRNVCQENGLTFPTDSEPVGRSYRMAINFVQEVL